MGLWLEFLESIESQHHLRKKNEAMKNYVNARIGNYVVFSTKQINSFKQDGESYFQGFWKMSFHGACSKSGNGVDIIFKNPQPCIYPHI